MFRISTCFIFALMAVGHVQAEQGTATAELPAALQAAGIDASFQVSAADAHAIRGQGGYNVPSSCYPVCVIPCPPRPCPPPTPCPPPCGPGQFAQHKTFKITGEATGTILLFEGVVGEFQHAQQTGTSTTVAEGNFGGLAGYLGAAPNGNFQFLLEGKALQEQIDFVGVYEQIFTQLYVK
ncbi:MAG: hypothetical protein KJ000_16940 [Pirellulaceae bacterium]|nr:hypothetical protein [Pirellulaceae bacterium]